MRYAIQDLETVEGLLYFTRKGGCTFATIITIIRNRSGSGAIAGGAVARRRSAAAKRFAGQPFAGRQACCRAKGKGGYSEREFVLADGLQVQLVSRRHAIDGRPTIIRVAYSEEPLCGSSSGPT